jgi:hypothetical protein
MSAKASSKATKPARKMRVIQPAMFEGTIPREKIRAAIIEVRNERMERERKARRSKS